MHAYTAFAATEPLRENPLAGSSAATLTATARFSGHRIGPDAHPAPKPNRLAVRSGSDQADHDLARSSDGSSACANTGGSAVRCSPLAPLPRMRELLRTISRHAVVNPWTESPPSPAGDADVRISSRSDGRVSPSARGDPSKFAENHGGRQEAGQALRACTLVDPAPTSFSRAEQG